ncbi:MAG TPA: GNAT family N-acetyltransferase [Acidobacteriaceae bacterium]|nr:GNAT family N-acetyltransferase [Acidobacteriaceae bacterium]
MTAQKGNTMSRFEVEEEGQTAYLEFELDNSGWITLWHTEVPEALRGRGVAGMLAQTALEYARDNKLKVDVVCPLVAGYVAKHPEFQGLVG